MSNGPQASQSIHDLVSRLHHTQLVARTVGLGLPNIDAGQLLPLFSTVRQLTTEFERLEPDIENQKLVLRNGGISADEEILLKYERAQEELTLAWGSQVLVDDIKALAKAIIAALPEGIPDLEGMVRYVDLKYVFDTVDIKANHYSIIHSLFFKAGPIGSLFEQKFLADNDIKVKGFLDQNTMCVFSVTGRTSDNEVRAGRFAEKKMRIMAGIARLTTSGSESVSDLWGPHWDRADEWMCGKFIPQIVQAFDAEVARAVSPLGMPEGRRDL